MDAERLPFTLPPDPPRNGVHLSTILKDILRTHDPKRYGGAITDQTRANFERGFALEDMLKARRLWPAHILLQQEFIDDGIIHTLDGFDARADITYESKCTLISSAEPIESPKFISWRWQLACYVRVSRSICAYLDILHLCGDWHPPQTLPPVRWKCRFPTREQEMVWSMVRKHRDRMVKKGLLKP